jgi:hypothetical protein
MGFITRADLEGVIERLRPCSYRQYLVELLADQQIECLQPTVH